MNRRTLFLTAIFLTGTAQATMFTESQKTDPLTGEQVSAWEIVSYGSYIYDWPSKYDQVFWPLTAEQWICINPRNGYAAFNNDFEKVSEEEKQVLTAWLAKNYMPSQAPKSYQEKLEWLEKLYRLRHMNDDFWCIFYRLMAYTYRDDPTRSLEYVKKALPLLEAKLKTNPQGIQRIEVLFLLGEYHRRTGDAAKSAEFFSQVKTAKYKGQDGTERTGHPYFVKLAQDREQAPAPAH